MVLINSGFHKLNNLSENIPQFGHAPSKLFASSILYRKSLRNIGLKGHPIIILPACLGLALVVRRRLVFTDVSGQPNGKYSTLATWGAWAVSQFGNQLSTYVAQRPRR
jgi:hypothetical protein